MGKPKLKKSRGKIDGIHLEISTNSGQDMQALLGRESSDTLKTLRKNEKNMHPFDCHFQIDVLLLKAKDEDQIQKAKNMGTNPMKRLQDLNFERK